MLVPWRPQPALPRATLAVDPLVREVFSGINVLMVNTLLFLPFRRFPRLVELWEGGRVSLSRRKGEKNHSGGVIAMSKESECGYE